MRSDIDDGHARLDIGRQYFVDISFPMAAHNNEGRNVPIFGVDVERLSGIQVGERPAIVERIIRSAGFLIVDFAMRGNHMQRLLDQCHHFRHLLAKRDNLCLHALHRTRRLLRKTHRQLPSTIGIGCAAAWIVIDDNASVQECGNSVVSRFERSRLLFERQSKDLGTRLIRSLQASRERDRSWS